MMHNDLKLDPNSGLINTAIYLPSPHCDDRPKGVAIDAIVIHSISLPPGQFGQNFVEAFFCGRLNPNEHPYFKNIQQLKVTSHLYIKREGSLIQFVPLIKRAWHAGVSLMQGRSRCNDFSIGIELEGTDDIPYTNVQYLKLSCIIKEIMHCYSDITWERIVGHLDISPGRKTDPGPAFDWVYLKDLIL